MYAITVREPGGPEVIGDLRISNGTWHFAGAAFEIRSSFSAGWSYELVAAPPGGGRLEVRIPDRSTGPVPSFPAPIDQATLHIHGGPTLPWLVFRHFLTAVRSAV